MHDDAPSTEYCPALHDRHTAAEVAPTVVEYFPAGQRVHVAAPAAEKVPAAHGLHAV